LSVPAPYWSVGGSEQLVLVGQVALCFVIIKNVRGRERVCVDHITSIVCEGIRPGMLFSRLEASLIGVSWLSGGKTNLVLKSPAIELHACPKLPDDGRVGYDIFNSIV
jgi:hypothetical protein